MEKSNKILNFSAYWKLIKQNSIDIGIEAKYDLYLFKYATINLTLQQINKITKFNHGISPL
jgi:hypothetical protein